MLRQTCTFQNNEVTLCDMSRLLLLVTRWFINMCFYLSGICRGTDGFPNALLTVRCINMLSCSRYENIVYDSMACGLQPSFRVQKITKQ